MPPKLRRPVACADFPIFYGEKCHFPSHLGGPGSVLSFNSWVRVRITTGNTFWHIVIAKERSFWHRYADAFSSSNSVSCHMSGTRRRFGAIAYCPNVKSRLFREAIFFRNCNSKHDSCFREVCVNIFTTNHVEICQNIWNSKLHGNQ